MSISFSRNVTTLAADGAWWEEAVPIPTLVLATVVLVLVFAFWPVPVFAAPAAETPSALTPYIYGADANDTGDPIGGGKGYSHIYTSGDYIVSNAAELVAALRSARIGQVVYITPEAEIDLTDYPVLYVNAGVTLAGNRGLNGSPGPLLFSTRYDTNPLIELKGLHARITGLRLRGPDGEIGEAAYFRPNSEAVRASAPFTEVDNCEIWDWSYAGVAVHAEDVHIHHNNIHHVRRTGLGYPVVVNRGTALIEANDFDYYRHAIASTGYYGTGYEARYNIVRENATSHAFDMHGGSDFCPKRAEYCPEEEVRIAGEYVVIHHNTFLVSRQRAIRVRGVPNEKVEVYGNRFATSDPDFAFQHYYFEGGNTSVYNNMYGPNNRIIANHILPDPYIRQCSGTCNGRGRIVALAPSMQGRSFRFISPPEEPRGAVVGLLPVELDVNIGADFVIAEVVLYLDDNVIYRGDKVPAPGEVVINTREYPDGKHRLQVEVRNTARETLRRQVELTTDNWWEMFDEFAAPMTSGWFGTIDFKRTIEESPGWGYATEDGEWLFLDHNRRIRIARPDKSPADEYLVWEAADLLEYQVDLFVTQKAWAEQVKLSVSADRQTWHVLPVKLAVVDETSRSINGKEEKWFKVELTESVPSGFPTGYFRLEVPSVIPLAEMELSAVKLKGVNK
ncbi:MAG TPA: hypothetical protein GXX29_06350 [Firmicutes bacterium]|nr:hypothetical protein [Bacillota bacterium]